MNGIQKSALGLVIIGALNWLLVGVFNWNLVAAIFGTGSLLSRAVYTLVGIAGLYCISLLAMPSRSAVRHEATDFRRAA